MLEHKFPNAVPLFSNLVPFACVQDVVAEFCEMCFLVR